MKKQQFSKGFTLVELLVVISIVSLLSSIVFASLNSARIKSRDAYRVSQVAEVQKALSLYYSNNGSYPANPFAFSCSDSVPHNWQSVISTLTGAGVLASSNYPKNTGIFASSYKNITKHITDLILPAVAEAAFGVSTYYSSPIQDPIYQTASDYLNSYGYWAASDGQSYKIRVHLEDSNSALFNSSQTGTFFDNNTTGCSACDRSLNYYCTGG